MMKPLFLITLALASLPWTEIVSSQQSASDEYTAKYQTQTQMRFKIDMKKYQCIQDKGSFTNSFYFPTCNRQGKYYYTCTAYSTCMCN